VIVVVVGVLPTTCESIAEVLVAKFVSPANTAVIGWVPIARVEIASVATPVALVVPVPIVVLLSMNVTVSPTAGTGATVAVNVTDCPSVEGFADDVSVVVVFAIFTVCDTPVETLVVKFVSPG
jgi:hypothetical protein